MRSRPDVAGPRRLLVIDSYVPRPAWGAGYPRAEALVAAAASLGWAVSLLPLDPADDGAGAALAPGVEVLVGHGAAGLAEALRMRRGEWDAVLVSRPENMRVLRAADGPPWGLLGGARLIYDAEALFSGRTAQRAALLGTPLDPAVQAALLAEEIGLTAGVDAVIAVTPAEAAVFRAGQAAPVHVVSHPVHPRPGPPFAARRGFLFVGRLNEQDAPNWDGLRWFIRDAWPRIRSALPDVFLNVVGGLHADTADLQAPGVRLLGPLAELGPAYDSARVFVAPTRYAAGVPIKALEAGAAGLPIVTTRLIAGQLGWRPGTEATAADDPADLADLAVRLHQDPAGWAAMQRAAQVRLAADHGSARFRQALGEALGWNSPLNP